MADASLPERARRNGRTRLLGLAMLALLCGVINLAGLWRAAHLHVGPAYRQLYLTPGRIVNGTTPRP